MRNQVNAKIDPLYLEKLRTECKDAFIRENPSFKGFIMSDRFMFEKVIDFFIKYYGR